MLKKPLQKPILRLLQLLQYPPPVQGDIAAAARSSVKTGVPGTKSGRRPVYAPRHYWPEVEDMPPLSHWPDRNQPFDYARSEVIAFIVALLVSPETEKFSIGGAARLGRPAHPKTGTEQKSLVESELALAVARGQ